MEQERFDRFTRVLARAQSRRMMLRSLAALGVMGVGVAARDDVSAARRGYTGPLNGLCPTGASSSGGTCVCSVQRTACLSGDSGILVACCQAGHICCFDGTCIPPDEFCAF